MSVNSQKKNHEVEYADISEKIVRKHQELRVKLSNPEDKFQGTPIET